MSHSARYLLATLLVGATAACATGPDYVRTAIDTPQAFKEAQGWSPAQPGSADITSAWWGAFGDPDLDALAGRVAVSNQNLAAAEAAFRQARAAVDQDRAGLFPEVALSVSGAKTNAAAVTSSSYQASAGASWAPDVWGRIRRSTESAKANAEATADDLAAATLSAQSELVIDYIQLRSADEQKRLLDLSIAGDSEALRIAQNRFGAGVGSQGDVAASQAQLAQVQAESIDLARQRAVLEHAIAVLIGKPPAEFSIPAAVWILQPPAIPVSVPSTLIERRPDVAAAERRVAAQNAQIGVAEAAFFPDLSLTASAGGASRALASVLSAPSRVWSLGGALSETLLDFGRTSATVSIARAGYDQSVAAYRQSALTAFQGVEDGLAAGRVLEDEQAARDRGASAADNAERIALNQYRAGVIDHTALIVAQNSAHDARIAALATTTQRLVNSVNLIAALGGGWRHAN